MRSLLRLAMISLVATIPATEAANGAKHAALPANPIHPGPAIERAFALTALQHLTGPAQRPFLNLLNSLPAKQVGVTISGKATKNMACAGGVCTPTAATATLNVGDVTRLLVDGTLTIATTAQAPDIFVNAPFSWVSGNGLTLQAIGNIVVNKAVSDSGPAPLTLTYNANGGGGALSFGDKGHIGFLSTGNALTINGQGYILASNIQTLAQLIARNPSGRFALSASYNAKHDGKYSHSPIPTVFQGSLEGLGNGITGLHIDAAGSTQDTGFLQEVDTGGVVANLTLGGTYKIHGKSGGGVVADNSGTLVQVVFDGTIDVPSSNGNYCETYMDIGGIAGTSSGTVSFSHATGSITGQCVEIAGGLLGRNSGSVDHSWAGVTLTATQNVCCNVEGGLIGFDRESGTIDWTFATGSITDSRGNALGGLIGAMWGSALSNSSSSGAVTGACCMIGGLVGDFYTENGYPVASIDTSVATGAVTGDANCWCGGAIGDAYDETGLDRISNTTSYGTVTGGTPYPGYQGGFVGVDDATGAMSNDGWCTTSSGITNPSQGAGNIPNAPGITPFTC